MKANKKAGKKMELLAPAGTVAVFETAITEGADAIYIGAPSLNARASGSEFSKDEIGSMISYAHGKNIKVYLAMNSLFKEDEIPQVVETLAMLSELKADSIIIQDLGIYHLARKFFPEIPLHASTLMGANNSLAVRQFEHMGFAKVVLARELSVKEIGRIKQRTKIDLEVFIHGALCFSYSGLCLFSSYLGGKSGLRGRCVQPCRRQYSFKDFKDNRKKKSSKSGASKSQKSGYFFSMNDLSGIGLLPQLKDAGVSSLKIEGRLRSSQYVGMVVRAYRLALDALYSSSLSFDSVLHEAESLLDTAMSRKICTGYLLSSRPNDIISPYHSGNIGLFLGKVLGTEKNNRAKLILRKSVKTGDRLRLHQDRTGERFGFSLKMMMLAGGVVNEAAAGEEVVIEIPQNHHRGDSIYKVDTVKRRSNEKLHKMIVSDRFYKPARTKIKARERKVLRDLKGQQSAKKTATTGKTAHRKSSVSLSLWLKIDDSRILRHQLPFKPEKILISLDRNTLKQFNQSKRYFQKYEKKIVWTLPAVLNEFDLEFYIKNIGKLVNSGFSAWQVSHIGQVQLFLKPERITFYGNYTLNILNSYSLDHLRHVGFKFAQITIETDLDSLRQICFKKRDSRKDIKLGLTVYGTPPLFTARVLDTHFNYGRVLLSPKGEEIVLDKKSGVTTALATKPFSLLPHLPDLASMGLTYGVVDLSKMRLKEKQLVELGRQISRFGKQWRLSSFNFGGHLQ